jgi:hypothetical protein
VLGRLLPGTTYTIRLGFALRAGHGAVAELSIRAALAAAAALLLSAMAPTPGHTTAGRAPTSARQ